MKKIEKSFVISPKELPIRRAVTGQHLREVGLDPILFSGLYGNDVRLNSGWNNPSRPYARWKDQTPNLLCFSLNHWFLWQHIVLAGLEAAMIFEDDVILPADFQNFFDRMMKQTPDDWEMIYMSILYPQNIQSGKISVEKVTDEVCRFKKSETWDGSVDGLHAYILSQSAAKTFTSLRLTLDESMDRWISFHGLPQVRTYIWNSSPVTQQSDRSGKTGETPGGFETTAHRNDKEWEEYRQSFKG